MGKNRRLIYILLIGVFFSPFLLGARYSYTLRNATADMLLADSVPPATIDSLPLLHPDSASIGRPLIPDSLRVDSLPADSLPSDSVKAKKGALEAIVDYTAKDSIVFTGNNFGYLYGEADIKYTNLELKAEMITVNMDSSIAYAVYGLDSIGEKFGYPILNQGGTDYEAETMRYNFKTQKAYITNFRTQQDDGFVMGSRAKKTPDNAYFMAGGRYTTCDDHEHPHFYLALTKAKVEPGKKIVTGPAYLVIEDLPLPIAIPFGFFPFTSKYSSGVIMPSYADEMDRGFGLLDGGYYFAINDYMDLAVTGDIYTKGSWALKARSTYRKRYKFSGSFDLSYMTTKLSDKGLPDYSLTKDSRINWTHSQDAKANTYRTLSASVNYSTSTYDRNSVNSMYGNNYSNNTKGSSVTLTQRFPNSPWSLNAAMTINQRSQDSSISVTLPNLTVTMSRINPFKRKNVVGDEKWYEKIQMSYSGDFRNSIDTKDNLLFKSNLKKDWKNAMKHSIPISATFSLFDHINVTPSINYTERWYTSKIHMKADSVTSSPVPADTTYQFSRVYDFSTAISFQTKLYGMYEPLFSKGTQIRHVFTPSVSFSYSPDFSDPMFGFYERYSYYDGNGDLQEYVYSPYQNGIFGTAPRGKSGMVSFQFENNLEMKVKSDADSTGFKKISLIDNLGIGFSHNFMAEKYKWSDISTNLRLKLSKTLTFNITAQWDPYAYRWDADKQQVERLDELRLKKYGTIARLRSTVYSISPSINQDTFKKWFGGDDSKEGKDNPSGPPPTDGTDGDNADGGAQAARGSMFEKKKDDGTYDNDGYLKNEIKWNLSFNFGMNYSYDMSTDGFDKVKNEYRGKWTKNFGLNGSIQPTKNWNFTFNTSYDFDAKKISDLYCTLTRDLHCWSISANFRPVGLYKTYFVVLRANSSLLQDLKYEQRGRSSSYDPNWD